MDRIATLEQIYNSGSYTFEQINELICGLSLGINVCRFANPVLTAEQMHRIRVDLVSEKFQEIPGIDIGEEFTFEQKELILHGFNSGINYKAYAKSGLTFEEMQQIRIELELEAV